MDNFQLLLLPFIFDYQCFSQIFLVDYLPLTLIDREIKHNYFFCLLQVSMMVQHPQALAVN